jgi:hypothetical protein
MEGVDVKDKRGLGIRVLSSFSIVGTFAGLAFLKWLGSLDQQGEGIVSLESVSSNHSWGYLLLFAGLILAGNWVRSGLRKSLKITREQATWMEASEGEEEDGWLEEPLLISLERMDEQRQRSWTIDQPA